MISLRRRIFALAFAAALTVGVVAATVGATSGDAKTVNDSKLPKTINLTAVEDMTGPVSYVGKAVVEGLTLAMDHINNSHLLGGSKLALTVLDTASSVSTATTVFSTAINSNASAIFGPLLSQEALATAPLAQQAKVVDLAIESQSDNLLPIGNYVWRATVSGLRFDNMIAEVVKTKVTGSKSVRILFDSATPSLVEADAELKTKFKALGFTVLPNIPLAITGAPTPPNWQAEATALRGRQPGRDRHPRDRRQQLAGRRGAAQQRLQRRAVRQRGRHRRSADPGWNGRERLRLRRRLQPLPRQQVQVIGDVHQHHHALLPGHDAERLQRDGLGRDV